MAALILSSICTALLIRTRPERNYVELKLRIQTWWWMVALSIFRRADTLLRAVFVVCVAYPVALLWLGISVRHRERLPLKGPAIVAANHNSHLDILALLSIFSFLCVRHVQPAAAADYFFKTPFLKWFSTNVIGIIPVVRGGVGQGVDPLADCCSALEAGKILVIFPEGTRGEPEQMAELKSGIWFLSGRFPQVPVVPVYMHGLGKSMPKGVGIPIPFFISIAIGRPLYWMEPKDVFIDMLKDRFEKLKQKSHPEKKMRAC